MMASLPKLTEGAIETIMKGGSVDHPVLQVLNLTKFYRKSAISWYKCCLSDGKHIISSGVMKEELYAKGGPDGLPKMSVIKVKKFGTSVDDSRDVIHIVIDMDVVASGEELNEIIGEPVPYTDVALPSTSGTTRKAPPTESERQKKRPRRKIPSVSNGDTSMNTTLGAPDQIIHPISSLIPSQTNCNIKARVMNKTPIKTRSGRGKIFSVDLCDKSGEIRLKLVRNTVDKYYDMLQIDKVYFITECRMHYVAKRPFSSLENDYEIISQTKTVIEECSEEDAREILQIKYDFTPIEKIQYIKSWTRARTYLDVIAIVKSTRDLQTVPSENPSKYPEDEETKRDMVLVDKSETAINLTLWNAQAENFDGSSNPVIALKAVKVIEYQGGKSLTTFMGTSLRINPEIPEAYQLKEWYDSEGRQTDYPNISTSLGSNSHAPWMRFRDVFEMHLDYSDDYYYTNKGVILLITLEDGPYKACPNEGCNKKIGSVRDGMYRCGRCHREFPKFKWRLSLNMKVTDDSGTQWITTFNEGAEKVIGMSAEEFAEIYERNFCAIFELFDKKCFTQYIFNCRVQAEESYWGGPRFKTVALNIDTIDYESYNAHLCDEIDELLKI